MEHERTTQRAPMQLGIIANDDMWAFEPLLLPQAVEALQRGEPLTVMGIMQEDTACGALAGYVADGCFHLYRCMWHRITEGRAGRAVCSVN